MIKEQPDWAKLIGKWRRDGGSGLTLPYLCVATGIQPDKLLSEIKEVGAYLSYCMYIHSILVIYHVPYPRYPSANNYISHEAWAKIQRETPTWPPAKREGTSVSGVAKSGLYAYLEINDRSEPVTPGMILSYIYSILLEGKESKSEDRGVYVWRKFSSQETSFIQKTLGHPPYRVVGVTEEGEIEYDASHWPKGKCKSSSPVLIT